jgi:hypothetical protein
MQGLGQFAPKGELKTLNQRVLGSSPRGGTRQVPQSQGVPVTNRNPFSLFRMERHTIATLFWPSGWLFLGQ